MKIDDHTKQSIIRNIALSLLIYVSPVLLMFLSFYITGKRPWKQVHANNTIVNPLNKKP